SIRRDDHLEFPRCKFGTYLISNVVRISPGVPLGAVAGRLEPLDKPVGGVGELCEDDELLEAARNDFMGLKALQQARPLRWNVAAIDNYCLDSTEEVIDRLLLLTSRSGCFRHDLSEITLSIVFPEGIGVAGGVGWIPTHTIPPATERLCQ